MRLRNSTLLNSKAKKEDDSNIAGGCHTLFTIPVSKAHTYKLYFGDLDAFTEELDQLFFKLEEANEWDTLEISIHSNGGYISELQRFENVIKNNFLNRTITFLNPYGYSAGAFLFLFGDQRVCYENSQIMFHDFSGGYVGKGSDMKNQMEFDIKFLEKYFRGIIEPYFTKDEIEKFFKGEEFWMGVEEMCRRGICTHVSVKGEIITAQEYLDFKKETSKQVKSKTPPVKSSKQSKAKKTK